MPKINSGPFISMVSYMKTGSFLISGLSWNSNLELTLAAVFSGYVVFWAGNESVRQGFDCWNYFLKVFKRLHFISIVCFIPFFVSFGDEVTKILRNLCLHFARQDGQDWKKWQENHATKVTKIPKTKRRKYGMNET